MAVIRSFYIVALIAIFSSDGVDGTTTCIQFTTTAAGKPPEKVPTVILDGMRTDISVLPHATIIPVTIQILSTYVAPETVPPAEPFYDIVIGTDSKPIYPGLFGNKATITRFQGGDTFTPVAPTDKIPAISGEVVNISPALFTDLYVQLERFADGSGSISAGYKDDMDPFISLYDPDPLEARYLGLWGDADWQICSALTLTSIATVADFFNDLGAQSFTLNNGNTVDDCLTLTDGSSNPSGLYARFTETMEVLGVQIWNKANTIEGAEIRVGDCGALDVFHEQPFPDASAIDNNIVCGKPISSQEAQDERIFRNCPGNTYGQFIYLTISDNAVFKLCEIEVYGRKVPDDKKEKVAFATTQFTVLENVASIDVTLVRSGIGTVIPPCFIGVLYAVSMSSTFSDGVFFKGLHPCGSGYDISGKLYVYFDILETTTNHTLDICDDAVVESQEYATYQLLYTNQDAMTSPSMTVTIVDDDPSYAFEPATYEPIEGVEQVNLTIKRSAYTAAESTITIRTDVTAGAAYDAESDNDFSALLTGVTMVTFEAGQIFKTVTIDIKDDGNIEPTEEFSVVIETEPEVYAKISIIDDEPNYGFSDAAYTGIETDEFVAVRIDNYGYIDVVGSVVITSSTITAENAADFDVDFPYYTKTIEFDEGDGFKIVEVPIINDKEVESSEDFEVTISGMFVDVKGTTTAQLTISDDDATVSMAVAIQAVAEREERVDIAINRVNSEFVDRPAWVDFEIVSTTATATEDYLLPQELRAVFEKNVDTVIVRIPIVDDYDVEPDEMFLVRIVDADSAVDVENIETTITIENDDARIYLLQSPDSVLEGETYVATVMREGSTDYTQYAFLNTNSDGPDAATAAEDFEIEFVTVEFDVGETTKTQNISTYQDDLLENDETFRVSISNPIDVIDQLRNEVTVQIIDDDSLVGFEQRSYQVLETTGAELVLSVIIQRRGATEDTATYNLYTQDVGSALGGKDYEEIFGLTVEFQPGEDEVPIDVVIKSDDEPEFPEIFQLILEDPLSTESNDVDRFRSTANVTIEDDDNGLFSFESTTYKVTEGTGFLNGAILRQGSIEGFVDLLVTTSPGSAGYPGDYKQQEVNVQFLPGQQSAEFHVDIVGDNDFQEGDEIFYLFLSVESDFGFVNPDRQEAVATIVDSKSGFSLSANSLKVLESTPGYVTVTISRSGTPTTNATISLKTIDGSATHSGDFVGFNLKTLFFPPGTAQLSFRIPIDNNDIFEESEETFTVEIISAQGEISADNALIFTIIDDDGYFAFSPKSFLDQPDDTVNYMVTETAGFSDIEVHRTGNLDGFSTVRAFTYEESAKGDVDFQSVNSRVLTFSPLQKMQTVRITIIDDDDQEDDETFHLQLEIPTNGIVISPHKARITILANDEPQGIHAAQLSNNAIIGITVASGGFAVILIISTVVFCVTARKTNKPQNTYPKPPFRRTLPKETENRLVQGFSSQYY